MKIAPLAAVAGLGLTLVLAGLSFADDDDHRERKGYKRPKRLTVPSDAPLVWKEECAACHMLYSPGLLPADAWREVVATNLDAAFHAARAQLPALLARGGGSLAFVGTFVGHTVGFPGMAAYASSKAGLIGLSQVIAAEYGARGVRSNVLLPGGTDTEMGRQAAPTGDARDFVRSLHALKRLAEPEEIANAALFLASDESSFVTGTAMRVEGGGSITRT